MRDDTPPVWIPEPPSPQHLVSPKRTPAFKRLKHCVWPECLNPPDPSVKSPLCFEHGLIVQDEYRSKAQRLTLESEAKRKASVVHRTPVEIARTTGQVYYLRLNDVIKIGWSKQLQVRLQDYTVGAELLAHHVGSRADERDLHRAFRPFLIHGREWYDGSASVLLDHIASVVAEHGKPVLSMERNAAGRSVSHKHWTGKR